MQKIIIYMDDSGVFHKNDKYVVYGGLVFSDQNCVDSFKRKYKSIIDSMKCKFCHTNKKRCNNRCPEIKHSNTNKKPSQVRRIQNLLKNEHLYFVAIDIHKVYDNIMDTKHSRGRYKDYAQKLIIKQIVNTLIEEKKIDPKKDLSIILNCDQDSSVTNGKYTFEDSIVEEFKYGIINWNYGVTFKPIIYSKLLVEKKSCVSKTTVLIQAADFVAGSVRQGLIDENFDFICDIKNKLYLPSAKK